MSPLLRLKKYWGIYGVSCPHDSVPGSFVVHRMRAVSAATMGYSVVRHWGCTLPAPRRQARQRCIVSGQRLPGQRSREAQRLIELVRVHLVDPCVCRKSRPFDLIKESRNAGHDGRALLFFLLKLLLSPFRPIIRLEAENAALRRQLIVLQRQVRGRVQFTNSDRLFFLQLYRWFPLIVKAMTTIRPETLVRWHRAGFRRYWRWKSRNLGGRPPIDAGLRALIREMSI